MKVIFYPRDIGMFRTGEFDFSDRGIINITLEMKYKKDYKEFYDRNELIQWLKEHKVRLDDAEYPLEFNKLDKPHPYFGAAYSVNQWSLLGWMKEL